ncbi:shikimate dehydrogenase [Clostridium bowmanii]|uniref:shikimate dehydrogenase n=1 Tax=Clostridium bowmanii TaxID=132925 RepID=UPI001C0CA98B|nr:shikimate dehydrogenase [Clostridium bowmanii]MBU3191270.1 shikimate dehydrogenase [Clostridium bowmanii]MCA1075719.1 shikimate dehydrogenase [Clostridium bowmanii]
MKYTGLLGNNIQYSQSPLIHKEYYKLNGFDFNYKLFDLQKNEITYFIENLDRNNIIGFNVTIPYKEHIISYLNKIIYPANEIGAVNTVAVTNGKLVGYNTDYLGFIKSLQVEGVKSLKGRALIIGNGGAAKSIFFALKNLGIQFIDIAGRNKQKVMEQFSEMHKFVEFNSSINCNNYDIIINCTPLGGMNNLEEFPLKLENTSEKNILYDLIYIPEKTRFLQQGEENGAKIINGKNMLEFQAHFAIDIWETSLEEQEDK